MIRAVHSLLEEGVVEGVFPAAQASLVAGGVVVHESAHGDHRGERTAPGTLFDVSSLTKVIATTSLAYHLLSRGALGLEERVGRWHPNATCRDATIRHLLSHASGLPPWRPLFLHSDGRGDEGDAARVIRAILETPLESKEGGVARYSDLGFILLGDILERVSSLPLDSLFLEVVAGPIALEHTRFRPVGRGPDASDSGGLAIAPTGKTRPRPPAPGQEGMYEEGAEDERYGEVDDDNAWAMGGVAGHAGLFSTAGDVSRWALAILEEMEGAGRLGRADVLRELVRPQGLRGPPRALGFDLPSPVETSSSLGGWRPKGPLGIVGHLGFTGCSVWIDLDARCAATLLSNRTYPDRRNDAIRRFRPAFHEAAEAALQTRI